MKTTLSVRAAALALVACCATVVAAQNVRITPLGSHAGELCSRDRATIFEDPTGVRILYDAGHSVTGGDDPRLGTVHVVLLSHAHGDHIGDQCEVMLSGRTIVVSGRVDPSRKQLDVIISSPEEAPTNALVRTAATFIRSATPTLAEDDEARLPAAQRAARQRVTSWVRAALVRRARS